MRASIARGNVRLAGAVFLSTSFIKCRTQKMLFTHASIHAGFLGIRTSPTAPARTSWERSPCETPRRRGRYRTWEWPDRVGAFLTRLEPLKDSNPRRLHVPHTLLEIHELRRDGRGQATNRPLSVDHGIHSTNTGPRFHNASSRTKPERIDVSHNKQCGAIHDADTVDGGNFHNRTGRQGKMIHQTDRKSISPPYGRISP